MIAYCDRNRLEFCPIGPDPRGPLIYLNIRILYYINIYYTLCLRCRYKFKINYTSSCEFYIDTHYTIIYYIIIYYYIRTTYTHVVVYFVVNFNIIA